MSGYNLIWAFIGLAVLSALGYVVVPKGTNQTVIRTMIVMTIACCYMTWAITYLAQLHPLIFPRKTNLRPHVEHE
ncbi:hypothetical protein RO3G_03918 [Lichtheimia corymbifera JMRC:FSU:9682]|uniref:Uncharacterized protein n=2 Tax=Lichtheimia TaxID=688353 RepID=A0A068RUU8_9FUNG|nr:uncharacterized protein O0I10_012801 [Lichtheimia ornata]KAJ8651638.1 hypothetical protein O0I10_012801 [Lichtheimia ornata]CDH53387.1 hypothetical protein RO3G_03918 [Lichtheimia corymbifera JMRC:FSU:9682]